MNNTKTEYRDYYDSEYPEYMEEYRLKNGYEKINGRLVPKEDPLSLNPQGIPTNDFGLPAVPGRNTMGIDAKTQLENNYLDQFIVYGFGFIEKKATTNFNRSNIPFITEIDDAAKNKLLNSGISAFSSIEKIENEVEKKLKNRQQVGNLQRKIEDGLLVIPVDGTYLIKYAGFFFTPPTLDRSKTPYTKEYMGEILVNENNTQVAFFSGTHVVSSQDAVTSMQISSFGRGVKIGVCCSESFIDNSPAMSSISIVKIS